MSNLTQQYVCFDQKTGDIFSIGPNINENYQHIEISEEQARPFQTMEENMVNYIVAYNRHHKKFVLKKNVYVEPELKFTKILPVDESMIYDLLLTVDKSNKTCYINAGVELIDTMKTTNVDLQKEITFSFTKKGDPHILYDMVTFVIADSTQAKLNIEDEYSIYANSDMATCMYEEV